MSNIVRITVKKITTYYDKVVDEVNIKNKTNYAILFSKRNEKESIGISLDGDLSEEVVENYNKNENKYGDALWETSNSGNEICSWNSDNSFFPCYDNPFFIRGSDFDNVSNAGIFSFNSRYGSRK